MSATIAPVVGGAEDTLAELHAASYRKLVGLAAVLLGDHAEAEDVVQDAFVNVFRGWDRVRDTGQIDRYLRSAVLNGVRRRRRRLDPRNRLRALPARHAPGADESALADERHQTVLRHLWALPVRQRECLALRYYADLSEAEIAEALKISAGSVKTHVHRGMAALGELMEADR